MTFRDEHDSAGSDRGASFDPVARFLELFAALDRDRGWLGDRTPLFHAAASLVTVPGNAAVLAAGVRAGDAALAQHFGWTSGVDPTLRLVLAGALLRLGDDPATFAAAVARGRALMRQAEMRRGGVHEILAMLVLRRIAGGEVTYEQVSRVRELYEASKRHHWFLTGPENYVALAMLSGRAGDPVALGEHIEAIYERLEAAPKTWAGAELQGAVNLLGLVELAPAEAADRYLSVATALRNGGIKVRGAQYDEVAILSFLPRSPERIASLVADVRARLLADLQRELRWMGDAMVVSLAASLAFSGLLVEEKDQRVATLGDAKLLLDMQSIVAMRQAAMGGAIGIAAAT